MYFYGNYNIAKNEIPKLLSDHTLVRCCNNDDATRYHRVTGSQEDNVSPNNRRSVSDPFQECDVMPDCPLTHPLLSHPIARLTTLIVVGSCSCDGFPR